MEVFIVLLKFIAFFTAIIFGLPWLVAGFILLYKTFRMIFIMIFFPPGEYERKVNKFGWDPVRASEWRRFLLWGLLFGPIIVWLFL